MTCREIIKKIQSIELQLGWMRRDLAGINPKLGLYAEMKEKIDVESKRVEDLKIKRDLIC